MKKLIFIEMAVLAVLLVVAVLVTDSRSQPPVPQDSLYASTHNTGSTQQTQSQATEPSPTWNTYPEDRQLLAKQYFVYDCKQRSFLLSSGQENDRVYPADITKLFTAYVSMLYLHPDTVYTIGDALDLVPPGSPVANIQKGDRLTARQLVEASLLASGSDAAYILACESGRLIAGQPQLDPASAVQAFMTEMNNRAKTYGMSSTHFVNPDGAHDSNHYSTFKDLTVLGGLCLENNTIMQNANVAEADIGLHGETVLWKNANALINTESPYYCPYAIGLKAGQTAENGSCLLAAFRKDGQFLLIGVFGCPEETDRFDDTLQLFNKVVLN